MHLGALGFLTAQGKAPLWIAAASAIGNGLQFFITPKAAWKAYGADGKGVSKEAVLDQCTRLHAIEQTRR